MIVLKFGGSCLDGPDDLRRMVRIVRSAESRRPVVVLSAFRGVTDELLGLADRAREGGFDATDLEARHLNLLHAVSAGARAGATAQVRRLLAGLNGSLGTISRRRRLYPKERDEVASYGEKLAVSLAIGYFAEVGMEGVPLSGAEAGIRTDGAFGDATITEESYSTVRRRLSGVQLPIVAGFFGVDSRGRITTLGRGASDYVATFVAAALGCKVVLYKDVDGVLTADPRIVPRARLVPRLNYRTAEELGRYGSKVLSEKAVAPAMEARIPIEIRNFKRPGPGTTVGARGDGVAVASIVGDRTGTTTGAASQGVSTVAVVGGDFSVAQVEARVHDAHLNPRRVYRSPSGVSVCIVVGSSESEDAVRALHDLIEA